MTLHTIADYEAECVRVEAIIAKSSRRAKGGWITYLHRLWKEMQTYEKYKKEVSDNGQVKRRNKSFDEVV